VAILFIQLDSVKLEGQHIVVTILVKEYLVMTLVELIKLFFVAIESV
jgi:hypothetical protein